MLLKSWCLLINIASIKAQLTVPIKSDENVTPCVRKILMEFYDYGTELTYVDINYDDSEEIIKVINSLYHVSLVSRSTVHRKLTVNQAYLVAASSACNFLNKFPQLQSEPEWHPQAKFLIVVQNLKKNELVPIFKKLLHLSVVDAVVINITSDPNVYTYNPFENYGCGRRFDRIIDKGSCMSKLEDIFFYKYETGLRNCTFYVNSPHWPPYSINREKIEGPMGVEEYVIKLMSEKERFNIVHYNYSNDAEDFSMVSENMSVNGPLVLIQKKKKDMVFGGMLLTHSRSEAFDYIYTHLHFNDDIRVLVKTATQVSLWRNLYLEFTLTVWIALLLVLVIFYFLMLLLLRPKDKTVIMFKMLDYFFQHGNKIVGKFRVKLVFLFWIWFSYLINSIYQSSLVGLTTNPSMNYQISNEDDIIKYKLKPCISPGIANYLFSVRNRSIEDNQSRGCGKLLQSIDTVSKSEDLYTIAMHSVYSYYQYNFYNEWGESQIYAFKQPLNNLLHGIFLYKGFPMLSKLQLLGLRFTESGIIDNFMEHMIVDQNTKHMFNTKTKEFRIILPWYFLFGGYLLSMVVFFIELNNKLRCGRKTQLILILGQYRNQIENSV